MKFIDILRSNLIQLSCPFQTLPNTDMTSHSFVLNASSALAKRSASAADKKRKHGESLELQPERMYKMSARTLRHIQTSSCGSLSSSSSCGGESLTRRRRTRQPRKSRSRPKQPKSDQQYVEFKLLPNRLVLPTSSSASQETSTVVPSGQYQLQLVNKNKPMCVSTVNFDQSVQKCHQLTTGSRRGRVARLKSCQAASDLNNKLSASRSNCRSSRTSQNCLFIKRKPNTLHTAASIIIVSPNLVNLSVLLGNLPVRTLSTFDACDLEVDKLFSGKAVVLSERVSATSVPYLRCHIFQLVL